jgi:sugar phosphate isomerase/epimerase
MDRRKFIQTSSIAVAGMLALPSWLEAKKKSAIGLQLYTLRDVIKSDVKGILTSVAQMGYTEAETYGYKDGKLFDMPVAEFGAFMKSIGMKTVSGHYGIDLTGNGWDKACEDAKSLGQKYVVVPFLNKEYYNSLDAVKKTCETLNKAGEVAKKYKLQMGYHNHAFEFGKVGDKTIFETMLELLDPKLVVWELDIFWVVNAGHDPVVYFEKYPGRFPLWHVKDMDKADSKNNADLGTGTIDYKSLFTHAKKSGLKNFFVEQETYPSTPMESTRNCINYLKTIL